MVQKEKFIFGFPIPIRYINPNLQFYPLVLPQNIVYIKRNDNHHINNANVNVKLNKNDHLYFIQLLMKCLNRNFTIIGDYLIDLTRQDYYLRVNTTKNKIYIQNYFYSKPCRYVTEKFFKGGDGEIFPKVDNNLKYNFFDTNNHQFIKEHVKRIVSGTCKIKNCIFT